MTNKNVSVRTKMSDTMKIECSAGSHTLYIDQPAAAGGSDAGPTPLEYYELSLAGCISTVARIVAKQKGITMRGMDITVSGDIDTDVLLGKNQIERAGFQSLCVSVTLDADLSLEQKREFLDEVERRCPISDNTSNSTPVHVKLND